MKATTGNEVVSSHGLESSEARKTTQAAISDGSAIIFKAFLSVILIIIS